MLHPHLPRRRPTDRVKRVGALLIGMALTLVFAAFILVADSTPRAEAATFTVTRLDDPAPDGCNSGVDCSLREAITQPMPRATPTRSPYRPALTR